MIAIPGGTFLMGSPEKEKGRKEDEGPQHPVAIKPFWMGKCEVTWEEYDLFWKNKPGNKIVQMEAEKAGLKGKEFDAVTRPTPPYADETFGHGRDGRPCQRWSGRVYHHAQAISTSWSGSRTQFRMPAPSLAPPIGTL